jgi:hypothetical protein
MFLVPKPGVNKLRLIIDLRELSSYCAEFKRPPAAQQRRAKRGCARRPVGTYLYLHALGDGNPVAVPGMAR